MQKESSALLLLTQTTAQLREPIPKRLRTEHEKRPCSVDTEEDDSSSEAQLPDPKKNRPNPKQTCPDPSLTHSNPLIIATVREEAATMTVAAAEARVIKAQKRAAPAAAAATASESALAMVVGAAEPAQAVRSA